MKGRIERRKMKIFPEKKTMEGRKEEKGKKAQEKCRKERRMKGGRMRRKENIKGKIGIRKEE